MGIDHTLFRARLHIRQYVHDAGYFAGTQPGFFHQRTNSRVDRFDVGASSGFRLARLWPDL